MIENCGELSIEDADNGNVPVSIFLHSYEPGDGMDYDGEQDTKDLWVLNADNYMPRRCGVASGVYLVFGTREELQDLVKKYILPLYQMAIQKIDTMINSPSGGQFYYWTDEYD